MKILCFSVTPSPYQRDFFRALYRAAYGKLSVHYLESVPDDSPWNELVLEPWESILPGRVFGRGRVRSHWNSQIPNLKDFDRVIVNAPLTAVTTQRIFSILEQRNAPPWYFWGEQLIARQGAHGALQKFLSSPLRRARVIVAIGRNAQADYQRRFPYLHVENIPYACDLSEYFNVAKHRVSSCTCRFLYVGQMIERKGVDVLLNAFVKIVEKGVEAELHLAGREGDLTSWLGLIPLEVQKYIFYHGFEQPSQLPNRFASADVFVLPSRHDGWGVVVNQALGSGMPVISSTAAGAGYDLIKQGLNGLHVIPGNVDSLADAMFQVASSREFRAEMSTAALVSAEQIGPDLAANRWLEVLG